MSGYDRGRRGPPDDDRGYDRPDRFADRLGPARGDRGVYRYGNACLQKLLCTSKSMFVRKAWTSPRHECSGFQERAIPQRSTASSGLQRPGSFLPRSANA